MTTRENNQLVLASGNSEYLAQRRAFIEEELAMRVGDKIVRFFKYKMMIIYYLLELTDTLNTMLLYVFTCSLWNILFSDLMCF